MQGLINELKRRNVFRVAVAYVAVSLGLIELTDAAVPALMLPEWSNSFVFFLLALGFPIAVIGAWALEMTPEGLRRARDSDLAPRDTVKVGDYVMMVAILVIAGTVVYSVFFSGDDSGPDGEVDGSAIVVLPFENLSVEAEEARFSQALTSDIRNRLTSIPGLQVASRGESIQFSEGASVREIGRLLGVAAVLEGNVQQVGSHLTVRAQLIDVDEGFAIWSATVDREVGDFLTVQNEVSQEIVERVRRSMAGGVEEPDEDEETAESTGELLSGARAALARRSAESLAEAVQLFRQALAVNASDADAHAGLAEAYLLMAAGPETYGDLALGDALAKARPFASRALELEPDSAYAIAVQGLVDLTGGQIDSAVEQLERATVRDGEFAPAYLWLYMSHLAAGRPAEGYASLERAYAIEPDAMAIGLNMSRLMMGRKQIGDAEAVISRLERLYPGNVNVMLAKAAILADMWQPVEAIAILRQANAAAPDLTSVQLMLGASYLDIGELDEASRWLEGRAAWVFLARGQVGPALNVARSRFRQQPGNVNHLFALADTEAAAGNHRTVADILGPLDHGGRPIGALFARSAVLLPAVTLAQAKKKLGDTAGAEALLQASQDYLDSQRSAGLEAPRYDYLEARINAVKGQGDLAIAALRRAVLRRFPGVAVLHWDPALESVRGRPDFQAMVADLDGDRARQRERLAALGQIGQAPAATGDGVASPSQPVE